MAVSEKNSCKNNQLNQKQWRNSLVCFELSHRELFYFFMGFLMMNFHECEFDFWLTFDVTFNKCVKVMK